MSILPPNHWSARSHNILAEQSHWSGLSADKKQAFRFLHVSTDEVYGSLGDGGLFEETTPYDPSSPYSASKAASDHLVTAWHRTYVTVSQSAP